VLRQGQNGLSYYLGIDGGQSSTVALIGDADGHIIGAAQGGPCNHVSSTEAAEKLTRVIGGCIAEACKQAGLDSTLTRFTSVCCGMSGGPADKLDLLARLIQSDHLVVKTDGEIALTGATSGRPGVVVIAGTGSLAFGRDRTGRVLRAGGWGYVFGDEGGAFDIVRQAVRAALRMEEGWGPATALHQMLLEATGAADANEAMHLFYQARWPRSRVARISRLVDKASMDGDVIARTILEQAAQSLASLAGCIRLHFQDKAEALPVAYVGGVFRSEAVLERFRLLIELTGECRCIEPEQDAAAGALLDAYREVGLNVTLSNVSPMK
jgi:N-acetylglucosamine kinase-like BadF-type ATPase